MTSCPLCEEPLIKEFDESIVKDRHDKGSDLPNNSDERLMSQPQRKATWELVFIILILISVITSLLNYILNKEISWSLYPVAVCMIIFSYISYFAFLNARKEIQFIFGFITASVLILFLDSITAGREWSFRVAIPLLLFANITVILLLRIIRGSRRKGINLIAYSFLAAALFCTSIEAIIDLYVKNHINLVWSLIVVACVLPISLVLIFIYFRLKKGGDLNKTFHL